MPPEPGSNTQQREPSAAQRLSAQRGVLSCEDAACLVRQSLRGGPRHPTPVLPLSLRQQRVEHAEDQRHQQQRKPQTTSVTKQRGPARHAHRCGYRPDLGACALLQWSALHKHKPRKKAKRTTPGTSSNGRPPAEPDPGPAQMLRTARQGLKITATGASKEQGRTFSRGERMERKGSSERTRDKNYDTRAEDPSNSLMHPCTGGVGHQVRR